MKKYEYKIILLKLKGAGIFGLKEAHGFEEALTEQGRQGWRYVDTVSRTGAYGEVGEIKLIFEREMEA